MIKTSTLVINLRITKVPYKYIGRGSLFGNPFFIGRDGTREEVIKKYRDWFVIQLEDPRFKSAVLKLKGKTLGCYCKPLACHGDVIAKYLEEEVI